MEEVVGTNDPLAVFDGKTILVTGHTGFKGTWLSLWLKKLGAKVVGLSLAPPQGEPSMFESVRLEGKITNIIGDICDRDLVREIVHDYRPSVVIHMAAQTLVNRSYREPRETFDTNVLGTINILEAIRMEGGVKACTVVTSDKCYSNDGRDRAYVEEDCLGGKDPYSASKAAAEIVTASYRWSYFSSPDNGMALSTARAGNVIGGGDWAEDRIVPDIVRGLLSSKSISVRNPASVRPWQHVLEPLNGYLLLIARMLKDTNSYSGPWNFGPDHRNCTVQDLVERFIRSWGEGTWVYSGKASERQKEARTLRLDSTKAKRGLGWRPQLQLDQAVDLTVEWYKADTSESYDMGEFSEQQIRAYSSMPSPESTE